MRRPVSLVAAGGLALIVSACGSAASRGSGAGGPAASSDPSTLLRDTFAGHTIKSGVVDLRLVITPRGSTRFTTPLSISLGGPFQSGGGHPAQSALTIGFSGLGKRGSLGVTTTTSGGYVTIDGTSYKLPGADFNKLQRSLGASTHSGATPGLSSLGIDPSHWVTHPRIVGTATVDGVVTEHVHAAVDVRALVRSLDQVLAKQSSTSHSPGSAASTVPTHITPAEASKLAAAITAPTVDVYADKNDSSLRRLVIDATLPVHGTLSAQLGGLTSASLRLSVGYSHVNEPQTISAPAHPRSATALQSRIASLGQALTGAGSITGSARAAGSPSQETTYAKCIQKANGAVARMQRCASLLKNSG